MHFDGKTFALDLGNNCIKKFHLGRFIVGFMVGNLVLQRWASGASERISDDISSQIKF